MARSGMHPFKSTKDVSHWVGVLANLRRQFRNGQAHGADDATMDSLLKRIKAVKAKVNIARQAEYAA